MDANNIVKPMKKSIGEIFIRYLLFYLAVVFFFSLYSSLLDFIFYRLDYGSTATFKFRFGEYLAYFGIGCFPIAAVMSVLYNLALSSLRLKYKFVKVLFGLLVGLFIGLMMKKNGYSFYIGEMRPLKNAILFPLIGFSVEIARLIKERNIKKKHLPKNGESTFTK
jgi:hypothetical protein